MLIILKETNFSILTWKSAADLSVVFLNHFSLASFSSFDHFAALAIWYLTSGSPVCKLCLVQSSAEKKKKNLLFDHELSMI